MKILEILTEESKPGLFVGVRFTSETEVALLNWIKENNIDQPTPREEFHSTLVSSKVKKFPWEAKKYSPPLKIDPSSYKLEMFGVDKNVLVLTFNSPELEKKHLMTRKKYNLDWDFDEYEPHMTLSYDGNNTIDGLKSPTFPLYISHEYTQDHD